MYIRFTHRHSNTEQRQPITTPWLSCALAEPGKTHGYRQRFWRFATVRLTGPEFFCCQNRFLLAVALLVVQEGSSARRLW